MNEKWLQDRIGLLINHYISLMQNETDRYEQTCKLLRDYYTAMEGGAGKDKSNPWISLFFIIDVLTLVIVVILNSSVFRKVIILFNWLLFLHEIIKKPYVF